MAAHERYSTAEACGARIRQLRERHHWTTAELASRAGFSQQQVSAVELGHINTPIETLQRFAEALGVALGVIVGAESGLSADDREEGDTTKPYTTTYCLRYFLGMDASIPSHQSRYSKTISGLSWLAALICASRYSRMDVSVYAAAS